MLYLGINGHFTGAADSLLLELAEAMVLASQMAVFGQKLMRYETGQIEMAIESLRGYPTAP